MDLWKMVALYSYSLMLMSIISHCVATEYYVKPTTPVNTTCLSHPCFTLSQYIGSNTFTSRTRSVFILLPGNHAIEKMLEITNTTNFVMKASSNESNTQIVIPSNFPCKDSECFLNTVDIAFEILCCSVIRLINVTNASIHNIGITGVKGITGISIKNSFQVHIHNININNFKNSFVIHTVGLFAYGSCGLCIDTVQVSNFVHGLVLVDTNSTKIMRSVMTENRDHGIILINTNSISISDILSLGNSGVFMWSSNFTTIDNISAVNSESGFIIHSCHNTILKRISAENFILTGLEMVSCYNTNVMNTNIITGNLSVDFLGIEIDSCNTTNITNLRQRNSKFLVEHCFDMTIDKVNVFTDVVYIQVAIYTTISSCINTTITDVSVINVWLNGGLVVNSCNDTTAVNIITVTTHTHGIWISNCHNTKMINITTNHFQGQGVSIDSSSNTNMWDVVSMNEIKETSLAYAILVAQSSNLTLSNSLVQQSRYGLSLWHCTGVTLVSISATANARFGIELTSSTDVTMENIVLYNNTNWGMFIRSCDVITIANLQSVDNRNDGIHLEMSAQIHLKNVSFTNTPSSGLSLTASYNNITLENSNLARISSKQNSLIQTQQLILLLDSTLTVIDCVFTRNNITSLRAVNSTIIARGNVIFSNNRAQSGAVFHFSKSSVLYIPENSLLVFDDNSAVECEGVFFINTDEYFSRSWSVQDIRLHALSGSVVSPTTECFIRVEGDRSDARLIFSNNTAGKGGDVLFGVLVALGWDGDMNCLRSFKSISDLTGQSGMSIISSEPSRVCLCYEAQPNCTIVSDPTTHTLYPGETITLSAVVVGQDFGTVSGSVIAQLLSSSAHLHDSQRSTLVTYFQCSNLSYIIYTSCKDCELVLVLK